MVTGSVTSAAVTGAPAWDVVVGDRFIAAVAAPAPDRVTTALADAAGDGRVSVERLVGFVPTGGADAVVSFAIVWWSDVDPGDMTVIVRGDAVVDLGSIGGVRRFDARGIHPWHLADFDAVVALRITAADAPLDRLGTASDPVRHSRASLRASSVEWAAAARTPDDEARARAHAHPHADADTILVVRREPTGELRTDGDTPIDELGTAEASVLTTPRAEPGDPVTTTPISVVPSESGLLSPVPAGPPAPADEPGRQVPGFRIGTGPVRRVTGPVLVGRRPLRPRIPESAGAAVELVAVSSPGGVVSGTHLELRVQGERLIATDLRSTNGTIVRNATGARRMRAGESIVVAPGTTLDLGDGTIVEIVPASGPLPE